METLSNPVHQKAGFTQTLFVILIAIAGLMNNLQASPLDWMYYYEDEGVTVDLSPCKDEHPTNQDVTLALSCKTQVNVSLGQGGYAVITSIMLVNAPVYPPFQYDVDIMGPLNDTAFCAQIGQELMVVVTEIPTGNSCMSIVFIEDKLDPVLICTPDTLPCNIDIASLDFESFLDVATDNCDDDLNLIYQYTVQNLPCNVNGFTQQINILWTAIDDSGNSTTCQDIIYLDKPPLSAIVFPPDISLSCVNPNLDPSVTGEPTFNGEPLGNTCQYMVFHTDQVVPMCNGAQKIIRLWTVMDACSGAQRTDAQEILLIDNVAPTLICPANLTIGTSPGVCTTKYTLPAPFVSDLCANTSMIDIDIFVSGVPGIFSPGQMVNLGLGVTSITIRATDPCGNSSMCVYTVTVRDLTPPIPICHSITVGIGPDGMATIVADLLNFPVIENCGILSKQIWRMTNTCNMPEDLLPGPDVKFCCEDVGDTLMVAFKVTDLSGNMNTCMFQVIVKDQLPPVAICQDITISVSGSGTIVVDPDQINNGSTDNCFITDITLTPATFECEDIGENIVTLTVIDQSGNSSTCTATVTIVDEVPPVALCENITVTIGVGGNVVIIADQIDNGSSDNCGIDTLLLSQSTFDCDDAGINIVTLTVVDFGGNTATCTATVVVLTSPPVALCQNITVSLNSLGQVSITADQINNGSTDDCGIDTITVTPNVFDCTDLGANIVTLTVLDLSGNTATCTATVTVQDNMPPIALCQDISIMLDANGMATITPAQINDGSTDNCTIVTITVNPNTFDCDDVGPNTVTLTVTDQSGNSSTCTATVTVLMPDPPVALCQNITVTLGSNGIVVITPEMIDNGSSSQCGDVTLELSQDTFDCEDLGVNVVILTVTDETGASSTCTATVTVEENPPVAICQNITVSLIGNTVTITAAQINNNSTDDCGIVEIEVTPATFDCDDLGPNVVTLTVTDASDNTSTCTAIVTVEDNTPPVALCQNITVTLNGDGIVIITGDSINNGSTDNCAIDTLIANPDTLDCEDIGVNIVVLTVIDESGNSSTCTASVTVNALPPMAICQDITVSLGPDGEIVIDPEDVDGGSISNCGGFTLSLDEDTFDCTEIGDNIVILTVTDASGITSTCTATVTIVDDTAPICSSQDITVSLNASGIVTITASQVNDGSSDNCDNIDLAVTPFEFDCEDLGDNEVILTVTDDSGNTSTCTAIVTVEDNTPPIALCQDITVALNGGGIVVITGLLIDDGSTDNCGIDTLFANPDTLDCEDIGVNIVILTVVDESGNSSTCTASVTVNALPPMAVCQDITVSLGPDGEIVIDPEDVDGGSISNCGDFTLSLDEDTFDCTEIGDNIVILTVTDASGITSTCTATVTIVDDTAPICSSQDITVSVNGAGTVTITAGQVNDGSTDNCENITLEVTPASFTCDNLGPNVVILTVTDESGNTSTCTATVTVVDDIAPICNAQDITVTLIGNMITILPSQVDDGSSDNCGDITLDVDPAVFDCEDLGPNVVVLTVTDESGNSSTCTAIVTVEENAGGLVANCQNVTIFLDSNGNAFIDPEDINNGSGGGCGQDSLTYDLSQTTFTCTDIGQNIVTLTVTDEEGNTATCTAIVTVLDNLPPIITCPPNVTVNCTDVTDPNNTGQFGNATATDNCPGVGIGENAVFNLNDCNVGTITRFFTATDNSGNTAQCTQLVTIINSDPFTEDDITWPATPVSVNICNSTDPDDIPNGEPVFDPQSLQCANPVATFSDQVQVIVDNNPNTPCQIITRTWTVTDNCQPGVTFTFVQTINVTDTTPPVIPNINNMTKTANANCVAFFTLIASATDCAGVTITNNSPYGATTGANASGNYPIGETVVIFTATDGCGNISTMDVVITVIDPDPTEFLCEKVIVILPEETEVTLCAEIFITFIPGGCSDENDFIISYSNTNPFDTCRIYDCGDVGVTTFPLFFWNLTGTELVDSCDNADLDLRDPDDNCMDGLVLIGNVESEDGLAVSEVNVNIMNVPMPPGTTDQAGQYKIEGLSEGTGYEITPMKDVNHKVGVSTLDLVLIQKHLLGRALLGSPYKMIAADANKSGHITAFDLLEIRKLILGITQRFPSNTSWRFVDKSYAFPDPYNPFLQPFAESIWIDSVTLSTADADFVGIKIGDVNGSYFLSGFANSEIEQRSSFDYKLSIQQSTVLADRTVIKAMEGQGSIDGLQFGINTSGLSSAQLSSIKSDVLSSDNWYYDQETGTIKISWTSATGEDIGGKTLLSWISERSEVEMLMTDELEPEAYTVQSGPVEIKTVVFINGGEEDVTEGEYHLYQNKPNPFSDGTLISFMLPAEESVRLVVQDIAGRTIYEHSLLGVKGYNEMLIKASDLKSPGLYYYTLYTEAASLTRKMSYTNN